MRLVDTSAWVEWLIGSDIGKAVAAAIPARQALLVPTIVQLELAKWLLREVGEDTADQVIAFTHMCRIAPLDTKIALAAAKLCRKLKARDRRCHCLRHGFAGGCRCFDLRRAFRWTARRQAHREDQGLSCDTSAARRPGKIVCPLLPRGHHI